MASQVGALFPHQLAFRDAFLADGAARHQFLLAPPGLGKGYVAQVIAHQAATGDEKGRVLVLAPGPLVMQFAFGIRALEPAAAVDVIDRRRLREIMGTPAEDGIFRSGQIVVMGIDFAKQDDVLPLLLETHWSLVVVDEAHYALRGLRQRVVRRLVDNTERLLLLSAIDLNPQFAAAMPQLQAVRWSRDEVDPQGRKLLIDVPRRIHLVSYERSVEEARFAHKVVKFVEGQPVSVGVEQRRFIKALMLRALSSSPIAIQDFLIRQRVRLDAKTEANEWWGSSSSESEDVAEPTVDSLPSVWSDAESAAAALDELISALDSSRVDSKADALRKLIREATSEREAMRFAVFTVFASTADYVAEILVDSGQGVQILTGSVPVAERMVAVDEWKASGGALILTDGASEGLSLTETHLVVHYDLPETVAQMEQRWGRVDRVGQPETVHAYGLRDVTRSLESEEQLLTLHGFLE